MVSAMSLMAPLAPRQTFMMEFVHSFFQKLPFNVLLTIAMKTKTISDLFKDCMEFLPANVCSFKFNSKNNKKRCETYSKLTKQSPEPCQ